MSRVCRHGCGRVAEKKRAECGPCRHKTDTKLRRAPSRRKSRGRKRSHFQNLTPEEWIAIYEAQGGRCAICGKPLKNRYDPKSEGQVSHCDHDHQLEKEVGPRLSTRGLLCGFPCNRWLYSYWTPERLRRAADYLQDPPARKVLVA